MRKSRKLLITALLLTVIAVTAIVPTLSWLSSKSQPVVNTFAGGAITIQIDEAPVNPAGKKIDGARVSNNTYKYTAGAVLDKDPTPKVIKGSDACYVFVCVDNQLTDKFTMNYNTDSWKKVATDGAKTLYAYSSTVDASAADADVVLAPVFTTVTVSTDLTAEDVTALGEKTVSVTAYAVQTASLTSKAAIDLAVKAFELNATPEYVTIGE